MDSHFTSAFINYLSFICLYCLLSTIGTFTTNCSSTETEALISFKHGLSDPSARLSSWVGENCCKWSGITCDAISGKVTKIDLRNSLGPTIFYHFGEYEDYERPLIDPKVFSQEYNKTCLQGEVSASLLELKYLNYLDLSWNNFEGAPIPYFLGMLKSLTYLNLSYANFGGKIPSHLGNLSNLNHLDLSHPPRILLHVENLRWLSHLSSLEYLNLEGVNLSSIQKNWMHIVNGLSSLSELHLSECGISNFDSSIAFLNITSLKVLDLSYNYWINSSIPLWLSNLTSLSTLNLAANQLQGTIPPDFVKSTNLQYLDLSWNRLRSNIEDHQPISFSQNLCKLRFLNLHGNRFEVKLEEFLDGFLNCSHNSLESLDLGNNGFVGEIPKSLGAFKNLRNLDLSFNNLQGSLPNSIGNLSLLQYLYTSVNFNLNGNIPSSFGQLSKLIEFESFVTSWNTTITEAHLVNLTSLKIFRIEQENKEALVFNISYDWIPPFRLKILHLKNCLVGPQYRAWLRIQTQLAEITLSDVGISGSVTNEWISNVSSHIVRLDLSNNLLEVKLSDVLASQKHSVDRSQNVLNDSISLMYPNLRYLDLRNNLLSGPIPPFRYPNLRYLYLQNNLLSGPIPPFRYPNLRYLDLQKNLFSGPIPSNINDLMPNLYHLDLSKNHLNGTIPSSIKTMNHLEVLSMSDNQLSGKLFDDWSRLKSLCVIDLANNNLYGKIPTTIGSLTSLNKLILNNNNLHGEILKYLQNCSLLTSIDLAGNRLLYGDLPSWVGVDVSELQLISLRSNRFSGTIPRQWCNLPSLRILDLSNNRLSGEIPSCFYNWTSFVQDYHDDIGLRYYHANGSHNYLSYEEKTRLVMKGTESEYSVILRYVLIIDLSRNKLRGEIPKEITKLIYLNTLNLSRNALVGTIPENIGAMKNLETLDLSCNHLSGRIPASLASLDFLTHLNMSFNNLTGRIPTSNHLQTLEDPSIYEGNNPSLCGSPLQTKCPGDESSNRVPTFFTIEEDGKENDSSFYIGMAIGFPVGLNILFFTIFTNEARRMFYLRFIDRVSRNILKTIGFLTIGVTRIIWRRSY